MVDDLDVRDLPQRTFVRQMRAYDEVDSTNSVALEWSARLAADELPALVIAAQQTSGRGRGENRWHSGPGALTFSLLIEPARHGILARDWPALSLTVGAAIATAMAGDLDGRDVRLKWPNDVFVEGRKAAGVLIESPLATPQRLVVGVGVNVNNSLEGTPTEVRERGVSMMELVSGAVSRGDLLARLLIQLERDFEALATDDVSLRLRWRRLCLLSGRSVLIADSGRTVAGTCLGIDDDGALRVQTGQSVERLFSGVVQEFGP